MSWWKKEIFLYMRKYLNNTAFSCYNNMFKFTWLTGNLKVNVANANYISVKH